MPYNPAKMMQISTKSVKGEPRYKQNKISIYDHSPMFHFQENFSLAYCRPYPPAYMVQILTKSVEGEPRYKQKRILVGYRVDSGATY